jgi:hypothetical protein
MRINRRFIAAVILTFCTPLIDSNAWLFAVQNKTTGRPAQSQAKTLADQNAELNQQIRQLTKEIKELHHNQRRVVDAIMMQIEETHLEKQEQKLSTAETQTRNLAVQEAQLESRLNNIENELVVRNIANRIEGERIVRTELQNQLEKVRADRQLAETEELRLRQKVDDINFRLDKIRLRLDEPEEEPSENK